MSRMFWLQPIVCLIVAFPEAKVAGAVTYLTNPGVYTAIPSSTFSDTPGEEVGNLFDATGSSWAIDSYAGNNPQGRDEGWISVALDQTYQITHLKFAPRKATRDTDSIDVLSVWVSSTPLAVDVTSGASTQAFLLSPRGGTPDLTLGPFASFDPVDYAFATTINGKYLVARFLNLSDTDNNRNLGGRTFLIGQVGSVPDPSSAMLFAGVYALLANPRSLMKRPRSS